MTVRWAWDVDPGPARIHAGHLHDLGRRIDAVLAENLARYTRFLSDLIRFPTVSGAADRGSERRYRMAMDACLARVQAEAERAGLDWRDHDGLVAVAEWPGRRGQHGSIGVAAHLDVVPPGGTWRRDPFGGEVVDGEIWGRGAQDDKGGVAMGLAAMDVLHRLGLTPKSDIRLIMGTLEETDDWPDMDLFLAREEAPTVTLVPDGAFPVVVGEKGIVTVEWHASWPGASANGLRFVGLRGGERHNVVPAEATLWVACAPGDVEETRRRLETLPLVHTVTPERDPPRAAAGAPCFAVRFRGRAAHGAFPQHGHNAVLDALRALDALWDGKGAARFARLLLDTCAAGDASGLGLDRAHTHMGDTSLNLGVAELGTGSGHVQVNVRFPVGVRLADVEARFRKAAVDTHEGLHIEHMTRGRPHEPIYLSPEDHPRLIHALQAAYKQGTGRAPDLATLAGTTYAKIFPLALAFGPQDESAGEPILAHQVDERITLERFEENIRVYAIALAILGIEGWDEGDERPP